MAAKIIEVSGHDSAAQWRQGQSAKRVSLLSEARMFDNRAVLARKTGRSPDRLRAKATSLRAQAARFAA